MSGAVAKCDAALNRAVNCNGQNDGTVRNCAKLGGTCGTYPDGKGGTAADCRVVPSCSDTDGLLHCSGNFLYQCFGGRGFGQDCGAIAATCATVGTDTTCFFHSPACGAAGYACSGNTLGWCPPAGRHFKFHC